MIIIIFLLCCVLLWLLVLVDDCCRSFTFNIHPYFYTVSSQVNILSSNNHCNINYFYSRVSIEDVSWVHNSFQSGYRIGDPEIRQTSDTLMMSLVASAWGYKMVTSDIFINDIHLVTDFSLFVCLTKSLRRLEKETVYFDIYLTTLINCRSRIYMGLELD